MNPVPELAPQLKQLRLSGILDSLDARNRQALDAKLAYTEFLSLLIQDEVARRIASPICRASARAPTPTGGRGLCRCAARSRVVEKGQPRRGDSAFVPPAGA